MKNLRRDLRRNYDFAEGNRLRRLIECYRNPGVHALIVFRFGHWLLDQHIVVRVLLVPIFVYLFHRMRSKWGIVLARQADIGPGLYIGHWGGIFVAGNTKIGENCSISQDVTIGVAGRGERRGCPTLGNNVYIAAGAKIVGKITIGNNVRVGPNAVVTKNIPDNSLVHVQPMRVVAFPKQYGGNEQTDRSES